MRTVLGVVLAAAVLATGQAGAQSTKPKPALKVLTKPEAAPAAPKLPTPPVNTMSCAIEANIGPPALLSGYLDAITPPACYQRFRGPGSRGLGKALLPGSWSLWPVS